ncbi:MAG: cupredoxin domain-containing protein [Elusimicrobiota bacterium]
MKKKFAAALCAIGLAAGAAKSSRAFLFFKTKPSPPLAAFKIAIRGTSFFPWEIVVPAGQKFKIVISNENALPSEFESFSLHREQIVPGHSRITIYLGPLSVGRYGFFDDFQLGTTGSLEVSMPKDKH